MKLFTRQHANMPFPVSGYDDSHYQRHLSIKVQENRHFECVDLYRGLAVVYRASANS